MSFKIKWGNKTKEEKKVLPKAEKKENKGIFQSSPKKVDANPRFEPAFPIGDENIMSNVAQTGKIHFKHQINGQLYTTACEAVLVDNSAIITGNCQSESIGFLEDDLSDPTPIKPTSNSQSLNTESKFTPNEGIDNDDE